MKRLFALVLALACMLTLLCAGCADKEPKKNENAGTSSQTGTDPAPAPEPASEPQPDAAAYPAYLELLRANREAILGYDWQKGFVTDEETYYSVPYGPTEAVALADVWGDVTPELLYLTANSMDGLRYSATLHVCAWDGGAVRELYGGDNAALDGQVGGGMAYRLFQTAEDKSLWIFADYYGEGDTQIYRKLSAEGEMTPLLTCQRNSFPTETAAGWETAEEYQLNGNACSQAEYEGNIPAAEAQNAGLIMRNLNYYEYSSDPDVTVPDGLFPYNKSGSAVTCDTAIDQLRALAGEPLDLTVDEAAFFASLPTDFCFLSGVGGWSSDIVIAPDGTFTGSYHDSDMGVTGEGYPDGTLYLCSFSGSFGEVRRLNEYTYSMRLTSLTVDPTPAEEWIEDGVRYVSSSPYGLDNADEILVYLPGSWTSLLPAGFLSWVSMPNAWGMGEDSAPYLLPFCGLYNVNAQQGWFSCTSPEG